MRTRRRRTSDDRVLDVHADAVDHQPTRITTADWCSCLRYGGGALTGVLRTQFDQTDATDTIDGPMTAVAHDRDADRDLLRPT